MVSESARTNWFGSEQYEVVEKLQGLVNDLGQIGHENWRPNSSVYITDYFLGQRAVPCLIGRSAGHPQIRDGSPMFTTELFYLDQRAGHARTLSRWYRLGQPLHPDILGRHRVDTV